MLKGENVVSFQARVFKFSGFRGMESRKFG